MALSGDRPQHGGEDLPRARGLVLLIINLGFVFANQESSQMRNRSAREMWSSVEEIDAHIDEVLATMISEGHSDERILDSVEQYRQILHESFTTGQPLPNENSMVMVPISPNDNEVEDSLREQGIDPDSDLGVEIRTHIEEALSNRGNSDNISPDNNQ